MHCLCLGWQIAFRVLSAGRMSPHFIISYPAGCHLTLLVLYVIPCRMSPHFISSVYHTLQDVFRLRKLDYQLLAHFQTETEVDELLLCLYAGHRCLVNAKSPEHRLYKYSVTDCATFTCVFVFQKLYTVPYGSTRILIQLTEVSLHISTVH